MNPQEASTVLNGSRGDDKVGPPRPRDDAEKRGAPRSDSKHLMGLSSPVDATQVTSTTPRREQAHATRLPRAHRKSSHRQPPPLQHLAHVTPSPTHSSLQPSHRHSSHQSSSGLRPATTQWPHHSYHPSATTKQDMSHQHSTSAWNRPSQPDARATPPPPPPPPPPHPVFVPRLYLAPVVHFVPSSSATIAPLPMTASIKPQHYTYPHHTEGVGSSLNHHNSNAWELPPDKNMRTEHRFPSHYPPPPVWVQAVPNGNVALAPPLWPYPEESSASSRHHSHLIHGLMVSQSTSGRAGETGEVVTSAQSTPTPTPTPPANSGTNLSPFSHTTTGSTAPHLIHRQPLGQYPLRESHHAHHYPRSHATFDPSSSADTTLVQQRAQGAVWDPFSQLAQSAIANGPSYTPPRHARTMSAVEPSAVEWNPFATVSCSTGTRFPSEKAQRRKRRHGAGNSADSDRNVVGGGHAAKNDSKLKQPEVYLSTEQHARDLTAPGLNYAGDTSIDKQSTFFMPESKPISNWRNERKNSGKQAVQQPAHKEPMFSSDGMRTGDTQVMSNRVKEECRVAEATEELRDKSAPGDIVSTLAHNQAPRGIKSEDDVENKLQQMLDEEERAPTDTSQHQHQHQHQHQAQGESCVQFREKLLARKECAEEDLLLLSAFRPATVMYRFLRERWRRSTPPFLRRNLRYRRLSAPRGHDQVLKCQGTTTSSLRRDNCPGQFVLVVQFVAVVGQRYGPVSSTASQKHSKQESRPRLTSFRISEQAHSTLSANSGTAAHGMRAMNEASDPGYGGQHPFLVSELAEFDGKGVTVSLAAGFSDGTSFFADSVALPFTSTPIFFSAKSKKYLDVVLHEDAPPTHHERNFAPDPGSRGPRRRSIVVRIAFSVTRLDSSCSNRRSVGDCERESDEHSSPRKRAKAATLREKGSLRSPSVAAKPPALSRYGAHVASFCCEAWENFFASASSNMSRTDSQREQVCMRLFGTSCHRHTAQLGDHANVAQRVRKTIAACCAMNVGAGSSINEKDSQRVLSASGDDGEDAISLQHSTTQSLRAYPQLYLNAKYVSEAMVKFEFVLRYHQHRWILPITPEEFQCPWCSCAHTAFYQLCLHVEASHPRFFCTLLVKSPRHIQIHISLCETPPLHAHSQEPSAELLREHHRNHQEFFYSTRYRPEFAPLKETRASASRTVDTTENDSSLSDEDGHHTTLHIFHDSLDICDPFSLASLLDDPVTRRRTLSKNRLSSFERPFFNWRDVSLTRHHDRTSHQCPRLVTPPPPPPSVTFSAASTVKQSPLEQVDGNGDGDSDAGGDDNDCHEHLFAWNMAMGERLPHSTKVFMTLWAQFIAVQPRIVKENMCELCRRFFVKNAELVSTSKHHAIAHLRNLLQTGLLTRSEVAKLLAELQGG